MRILLLTHPSYPAEPLVRLFSQAGLPADHCSDSETFLYRSLTERYAAVIVRHTGSAEELVALYSKWRQEGCTSIFAVVTPCQSLLRRAQALELGVSLYYVEPCSYVRLVADVVAQEFRRGLAGRASYHTRTFEIEVVSRSVLFRGAPLRLTRRQFDILSYFVRMRGTVVSRPQIWEEVWGYEDYGVGNTVDVHVYRLRRSLHDEDGRLITTVHGIGYRMHELA